MTYQFLKRIVPSVQKYDDITGTLTEIKGIDVLEVSPETSSTVATHPGESGKVYADSRVLKPSRYHAVLAVPENALTPKDAALGNLLDASFRGEPIKYAVASFYSKCYGMAVVSSRHRDTPDMVGLRVQDVVFEECLVYGTLKEPIPAETEDTSTAIAPVGTL